MFVWLGLGGMQGVWDDGEDGDERGLRPALYTSPSSNHIRSLHTSLRFRDTDPSGVVSELDIEWLEHEEPHHRASSFIPAGSRWTSANNVCRALHDWTRAVRCSAVQRGPLDTTIVPILVG